MGESNKSKEPEQSNNPIVIALSYLRVEKLSRIEVFLFGKSSNGFFSFKLFNIS